MKPSIGRIVHFVHARGHFAAIVTGVLETPDDVNLTVFSPWQDGAFAKDAVPFDATGSRPGTWHWPERVD